MNTTTLIAEGTPVRYKDAEYYPVAIAQMREWIADCQWNDLDGEDAIEELSDYEVLHGVAKHYDGGLNQFLTDMGCE